MRPLADPLAALGHLLEALLFAFRLDAPRRTFVLITEYPILLSPGSQREFVAFQFTEVDFEREDGEQPYARRYVDQYQASGDGGVVVQFLRRGTSADGRPELEVFFGSGFGGFTIRYATVEGVSRGAVAEQNAREDWEYRDCVTQAPFEFHYPFPDLVPVAAPAPVRPARPAFAPSRPPAARGVPRRRVRPPNHRDQRR